MLHVSPLFSSLLRLHLTPFPASAPSTLSTCPRPSPRCQPRPCLLCCRGHRLLSPHCLPADSYYPSAFLSLTSAVYWTGARQQSGGRGGKSSPPVHDLQHRRRTSCNLFIATPRAAALSAFKQQLPGVEIRRVVEYIGELAVSLKSGLHQVLVSLKMAF